MPMEFQLAQALEILQRTPATLNALLRGVSEDWTHNHEGGESWSPHAVVGHLIHGEETDWIPRAKIILEYGESKAFEPFDRFAMLEKFKNSSLLELLDLFAEWRQRSLSALVQLNITPEKLGRRGLHPELGTVTLHQLLATWVVHDLSHLAQIARVMCKQYQEAVGPWQAYLPILHR
ncbi:MAG: DinB family protein [bacterium]